MNRKGKDFRDIGYLSGVEATEWSWAPFFLDADQDGLTDLFVANGIKRDMTNMDFVKRNYGDNYTDMANPRKQGGVNPGSLPSVSTANFLFQNQGNLQFAKQTDSWGLTDKVHTRFAAAMRKVE